MNTVNKEELEEYSQRRSSSKVGRANAYRLENIPEIIPSQRKSSKIILKEFLHYKQEERIKLERQQTGFDKMKVRPLGFFERLYWYIRNKYIRKNIEDINSKKYDK